MSFHTIRMLPVAMLAAAVLAFGIGSAKASPWSGNIPMTNFTNDYQSIWRSARWCASMTGTGHNRYLTLHVQYQKRRELLCSESAQDDPDNSSCMWAPPQSVKLTDEVRKAISYDNRNKLDDWHTTIRYNGIPIRYHATNGWEQTQRTDGIYTFSTGSNGISGVFNTNTNALSSLTINKPGKLASYSATITAQGCAGWTP